MKFKIFIFAFLIGIMAMAFAGEVGAVSSSVTYPNSQPSVNSYYSSSQMNTYWPAFGDPENCEARQDIILQIAPAGCKPVVVPSDLLADQNVPVFCQVNAIKINPLIDIKEITNIRFSGSYPKEVVGTGFHPAKAALNSEDNLIGSPLLENIGYVVVVLKKNGNESSLPKGINFTLGAQIQYESGNSLGVGRAEFKLKELSAGESANLPETGEQSFWNGKYNLRAESITPEKITISIYQGNTKITTQVVERGKTSKEIYVPGSYCRAALEINYDGLEADQNSARIEVSSGKGSDNLDAYKGSSFANGKCSIKKIDALNENVGGVDINCGGKTLSLSIGARSSTGGALSDLSLGSSGSSDKDKDFDDAIKDYEKVANDFPAEKDGGGNGEYYGKKALDAAIKLAQDSRKKPATEARLLNEMISRYPDSSEVYKKRLSELTNSDYSGAVQTIKIDGEYKTISLRGFNIAKEKSSATFLIGNSNRITLEPGKKNEGTFGTGSFLELNLLEADKVKVSYKCSDGKTEGKDEVILIHESRMICAQSVTFDSSDMKSVARVRVTPRAKGTETITNLSIGIGIEKRAIKLSPEKTKERIASLDRTIAKWQKISNTLASTVRVLKTSCLATSAVLTLKNLITGFDGTALARQKVMRDKGGWTEYCTNHKEEYSGSLNACYNANAADINTDVAKTEEAINKVNAQIANVQKGFTKSDGSIDEEGAKKALAKIIREGDYRDKEIVLQGGTWKNSDGEEGSGTIRVSEVLAVENLGSMKYSEVRNLYMDLERQNAGGLSKEVGEGLASSALSQNALSINSNILANERNKASTTSGGVRIPMPIASGNWMTSVAEVGQTSSLPEATRGSLGPEITDYSTANVAGGEGVTATPGRYALGLKKIQGSEQYKVVNAFRIDEKGNTINDVKNLNVILSGANLDNFLSSTKLPHAINPASGETYHNEFIDAEVRYYETEPYKGMPAIVPIDLNNGWYVATKQTLPAFGGIGAFGSSGAVVSFSLCNVGKDRKVDFFSGINDDICQLINLNTGQPLGVYPGLSDEAYVKSLVNKGVSAINDATSQYGTKKNVNILGQNIKVGNAASDIPSTQCQDFMSPVECQILFNVCDPVMCPTSRCNLGGQYQVSDVIRSGIVGSTLLCLPNINEGVFIPVCLTGIQAGVDSLTSIFKSYRDCLNESVSTGKMVGICDQIYSVYMCKLLWEQVTPVLDAVIPNLVATLYGQGTRGGGEYLTVDGAWKKADDSVSYMTQEYGINVFEVFKARAIEEITGQVCDAYVSASAPTSFKGMIEPKSPSQFTASFSSRKFNDVTIPATLQYKVFYHIYAGKDEGAYYSVYLKSSGESSSYSTPATISVASGFIGQGAYASETKDFTAPEGYRELCVDINGEEKCGFGEVTTSVAIDYLSKQYSAQQASQKNIRSESACISGTASAGALIAGAGNLQASAGEAVLPEIYNRGITRICSTQNPGSSTNPQRFENVGNCGEEKMICWLDTESLKNAVSASNQVMKDATISGLDKKTQDTLSGKEGYLSENEVAAKIPGIEDEIAHGINDVADIPKAKTAMINLISQIDYIYSGIWLNTQKANLLFLKGTAREALVRKYLSGAVDNVDAIGASGATVGAGVGAGVGGVAGASAKTWTYDSAIKHIEDLDKLSSYSDNKQFIDEVYKSNLINKEGYEEITGDGVFNVEETLAYVQDLLLDNLAKTLGSSSKKEVLVYVVGGKPYTINNPPRLVMLSSSKSACSSASIRINDGSSDSARFSDSNRAVFELRKKIRVGVNNFEILCLDAQNKPTGITKKFELTISDTKASSSSTGTGVTPSASTSVTAPSSPSTPPATTESPSSTSAGASVGIAPPAGTPSSTPKLTLSISKDDKYSYGGSSVLVIKRSSEEDCYSIEIDVNDIVRSVPFNSENIAVLDLARVNLITNNVAEVSCFDENRERTGVSETFTFSI